MKRKFYAFVLILGFLLCITPLVNAISPNVTVDISGNGDYTSIQAAIDAAPSNLTEQYVIFIKNGRYDEKIFITKNYITLLGEDRDSTIIVQAILRRIWRETNESDWGVATINIQDGVTDLTLANLTILNNFAEVYPDTPNPNDHTMAIRGGGHRIKIINCNVIATGGDTLSLWNTDGGMFYHASCYFEGYVDYVCPRGYCYIDGGEFYGYNNNASIWHDGSGGKDHKFVIRNSSFDGVPGFALGRYHRMAAFYLIDSYFSIEMKDQNISYVGDSVSSDRDKLVYGERVYYHNCSRGGGDYDWHADNLETAENSPSAEAIDAKWTFNNEWDPVSEIVGLVPVPILPSPFQKTGNVKSDAILSWFPVEEAVSYNVYLGKDSVLEFKANVTDTLFDPQGLENQSIYFWRVDAITETDTTEGEIWQFRTKITEAPEKASNPSPEDGSEMTESAFYLEWDFLDWVTDSFYVYMDTVPDPGLFRKTTRNQVMVYNLEHGKTYYWRVDTKNNIGTTTGDIWKFTFIDTTVTSLHQYQTESGFTIHRLFPNPASYQLNIEISPTISDSFIFNFYSLSGKLLYSDRTFLESDETRLISYSIPDILGKDFISQFVVCEIQNSTSRQVYKIQIITDKEE